MKMAPIVRSGRLSAFFCDTDKKRLSAHYEPVAIYESGSRGVEPGQELGRAQHLEGVGV